MCAGQQRDVLRLQEALASAQTASMATTQQGDAEHLAGSATVSDMCPQGTDQAMPEQPAAQARKVGSETTEISQQSAGTEDSHPVAAAAAPDLWCPEAPASLGHGTVEHRPGKGKSRPPFVRDMLTRQAAKVKRSMRAREQRRLQVAQAATSSAAESSGHACAAAAAAAVRRAQGKRSLGKGRPLAIGTFLPKQQAAARCRQPSQKQMHGVTDGAHMS